MVLQIKTGCINQLVVRKWKSKFVQCAAHIHNNDLSPAIVDSGIDMSREKMDRKIQPIVVMPFHDFLEADIEPWFAVVLLLDLEQDEL